MEVNKELVLQVNELFHDFEGDRYHEKHDDIFDGERDRWSEVGLMLESDHSSGARRLLDIGTGTGFVPLTLGRFLKEGDVFICSDISKNILDAAKKNIGHESFQCNFEFLKVDGNSFVGIADGSIDIVTVNSVLHHLPDLDSFFEEMSRVLKQGGRVIIGHEPNQSFFRNHFLWTQYEVLTLISHPKQLAYRIIKSIGLLTIAKKITRNQSLSGLSEYQQIVQRINQSLLERRVITRPLSEPEVSQLIDFQSPTAGGFDSEKGINIPDILNRHQEFSTVSYETYNHVYRLSHKNILLQRYSSFLRSYFPNDGAAFFAVLEKR